MSNRANINEIKWGGPKAKLARVLFAAAIALAGVGLSSASADDLEFVWARSFGGTNTDNGLGAALDPSGDAVIVGYFRETVDFDPTAGVDERTSNGHFDVFVTKLGADGSYQWTATFGSTSQDQANAVAIDDAGNIFIAGQFRFAVDFDPTAGEDIHTTVNDSTDIFLTKLNSDGSYGWTYTVGGDSTDIAMAVTSDGIGNVIVAGTFQFTVDFDPTENEDIHTAIDGLDSFITKLGPDGGYQWTQAIGGASDVNTDGLATDGSGNVLATGNFRNSVDFDPGPGTDNRNSISGSRDVFILKLSADGSYEWAATFGGNNNDEGFGIGSGPEDAVFVAGAFRNTVDFDPGPGVDSHPSHGSADAFVTALGADGSHLWARTFGASESDAARGLAVDANGDVVVTGEFRSTVDFDPSEGEDFRVSNGGGDVFISAFNNSGTYGGTYTAGGTGTERGRAIGVKSESVVVTGEFESSVDFDPTGEGDVHTSNGSTDVFALNVLSSTTAGPGACCIDVDCTMLLEVDCADADGKFFGEGNNCDDISCGGGACCVGPECSIVLQSECDKLEGEFSGPDTFCEADTCPEGLLPADGWWTYQHDAQRTGRTDAVLYDHPNRLWSLHTGELESPSPAIGPDGTIYVEGNPGFIAVRPDGSLRWSSLFQSRNTPAIRSDGHLFVPAVNSLSLIDHTDGSSICETGNTTDFATVIDPEGNCIYCISGFCRQISPGCDEQWTTAGFTVASHPVLDHDGGIYVAGPFAIIKIDPLTGDELWSFATSGPAGDPAIGADDSIYCTVEPDMVLALNPDGSERWITVLTDYGTEGSASPAIAADGTLYVVGQVPPGFDHLLVALSPDGDELWRFTEPNSGDPQAPVIDGDGTILFSMRDHQHLVALAPEDGSELWRVGVGGDPLIETNNYASGPIDLPVETDAEHTITIEDEGMVLDLNVQIRVLHERVGDLRITLTHLETSVIVLDQVCGDFSDFACTMLDDEADWIIEEHCESGFCAMYQPSNPLSAFDGMPLAGEWILTIEDLEPGNIGTFEDWFLQIEAVLGLDDTVRSSPAIGEDGTIYVTTAKGFLIALGVGCPEPDPVIPPYSYRVVAEEGQLIDGVTIQEFEHVEIGEDGLVSFQALVSPGNVAASFRELGDGSFQVIAQGTVIDNAEVDAAFLARVDAAGTPYMPANILKLGTAVFIDDLMVMHEGPDEHHISIADFERFDYVDPDEQGRFVVYGRQESTDPPSLLLVDPKDSSITPLVSHGQIIEGFMVENLDPAFVDGFGDDGVVLFRASDGSTKAIATNDRIVAREGDEIDGRVLLHVEMPRRNADGWFYYIGEHAPAGGRSIFLESPEGMDAFARGVGDTVAGQPILSVLSFAVNNQNNLAYVALSVGAGGVFVDDQPVAVVNISRIDGQLVTGVENTLSINESHQIAFVANVAGGPEQLYVATFDSDIDDCNENDIPDCEELQAGTASDCNTNGLLDECDISEGESSDNNANGVPDECECLADFDGSDTVDAFDLALLLGSWGPCPGCPADIDGNGVVDAFDLAQLLGSWGPC